MFNINRSITIIRRYGGKVGMFLEIAEEALIEGNDQVGLSPFGDPVSSDNRQTVGGDFIG